MAMELENGLSTVENEKFAVEYTVEREKNEKLSELSRSLLLDDWNEGEDPFVNLWALRHHALTKGGFVSASVRKIAWPLLVGLKRRKDRDNKEGDQSILPPTPPCCCCGDNASSKGADFSLPSSSCCIPERELDLIQRDAGRSVLYHYYKTMTDTTKTDSDMPTGELTSQSSLSFAEQKKRLATVLERTIATPLAPGQAKIHYYQGLHDIAGVLLYNMEEVSLTTAILRRLCQSHLREGVREHFSLVNWWVDRVLFPLLQQVDEELHDFLQLSGIELSNAVLPWIITWFIHDIHDGEVASRLVDAFLCAHPLLPLYTAAALLAHPPHKHELLHMTECDPAMIHMTLRTFPTRIVSDWRTSNNTDDGPPAYIPPEQQEVPAQNLLDDALHFMKQIPPRSLLSIANDAKDRGQNSDEKDCPKSSCSVNKMAACISLLKAPPSWALASTAALSFEKSSRQRRPDTSFRHDHHVKNACKPGNENDGKKNESDHAILSKPSASGSETTKVVDAANDLLLASTTATNKTYEVENCRYDRAKIASGVTILMRTVPEECSTFRGGFQHQGRRRLQSTAHSGMGVVATVPPSQTVSFPSVWALLKGILWGGNLWTERRLRNPKQPSQR